MSDVKDTNPKDAVGTKKVPYSLIPGNVLGELALAFLEGARKYGSYNWRVAGVRSSVYTDAMKRHVEAYINGEFIDPDSGLPHLIKAMACLVILRDSQTVENWVDDRPPAIHVGWIQELNKKAEEIINRYPNAKEPYTEKKNKKCISTTCSCVYESDCHGIEIIKTPSGQEISIGGTNHKDRFKFCPYCGKLIKNAKI